MGADRVFMALVVFVAAFFCLVGSIDASAGDADLHYRYSLVFNSHVFVEITVGGLLVLLVLFFSR